MDKSYQQPEMVINIKEIIWDLLEQWKAILIVALVTMLIVVGAKYAKDIKSFNAGEEQKAAETKEHVTAEEKIEGILEGLPEDERLTAEYLVKQNEWIAAEKEYVNNSIMFNTDPTNQRVLILDYHIAAEDSSNSPIASLTYGYRGYVKNEKVTRNIGQVISPSTEGRYIGELISCGNGSDDNLEDPDHNDAVIEVKIILPEDVEAKDVENALTSTLYEYATELGKSIGPHKIKLISSGESYQYNRTLVEHRNNVLYSIYNHTNNIKNIKASLTDGQKVALEQIEKIKNEELKLQESQSDNAELTKEETIDAVKRPRFSKKYALLGLILGTMLYTLVYLMIVVLRGRLGSASDAEYYTQTRLLGEIYPKKQRKGLQILLRSNLVDKYRYRGKDDVEKQLEKARASIDMLCKHTGIDNLSLFNMAEGEESIIDKIIEKLSSDNNIDIRIIDATKDFEEKLVLENNASICAVSKSTKAKDLADIVGLCNQFGVSTLGSIFIGD